MSIYISIFAVASLFLFFDDIKKVILSAIKIKYFEQIEKTISRIKSKRKVPIAEKIKILENGEKINFIQKSYGDMKKTLTLTGTTSKLKTMHIVSFFTGAAGVIISIALGNYVLMPILAVGFALVPMWLTKISEYKFRKKLNAELSVVLSVITTSYIRTGNIIKAVEENLEFAKKPVKQAFSEFVYNYKMVDKDIVANIEKLSKKMDNKIFKLWCQELIICQKDLSHSSNLTAVVNQLSADKAIQDSLSLKLQTPISDILKLMIISLMVFPVLYSFGNGMIETLLGTPIGQLLSSALCLCNLMGLNKAINISAPIE